jgi:hypothetical protein
MAALTVGHVDSQCEGQLMSHLFQCSYIKHLQCENVTWIEIEGRESHVRSNFNGCNIMYRY